MYRLWPVGVNDSNIPAGVGRFGYDITLLGIQTISCRISFDRIFYGDKFVWTKILPIGHWQDFSKSSLTIAKPHPLLEYA